jgi:5-methylcytosine-specific restriction enzyme subunit McrC
MLLHPQIGGAVDEWMTVQGHRMHFKTIDLTTSAAEFEAELIHNLVPCQSIGGNASSRWISPSG